MQTIFSGIQPTGDVHLGNYIGAIRHWVELQSQELRNIYCIVDMHAITVFQEPKILKENILKMIAFLIACGIDTNKSILFAQSSNEHHAELGWILNCVARIGWLNRMTQFKDKAGKDKEKSSVGLYVYPNLQAGDILLYDSNLVPVGEDQKQHIELARDIALKFNRDYQCDLFTIPEPLIIKEQARVMSFKDVSKKMSKSDPSEYAKIMFSDSNDDIMQKAMKAKTDSLPFPSNIEELNERLEIKNLLAVYSFCSKEEMLSIMKKYYGQGFSNFKKDLGELLINLISPIRLRQEDLFKNKDYLFTLLKDGSIRSKEISSLNIQKVKEAVGFLKI